MSLEVNAAAEVPPTNWRCVQAEHQERLARLSTAMAAAYEGDVSFAKTSGEAIYLRRRAGEYRRDARCHWAKSRQLRGAP